MTPERGSGPARRRATTGKVAKMSGSKAEGRATRRPRPATERAGPSREVTEQALIDGALDLLRERGILAGMNLREIADQASVTRGLAYHYFGSRQELLRAAAKREIARPRDEVPGESEMEFSEWLATMLDLSFDYKEAVRLIVLLVLDHDDTVKTLTTRRAVMSRIDEAVSERTLALDDPEAIYAVFASVSYGFSLLSQRFAAELDCDPADLEERVLEVCRLMFGALERVPEPPARSSRRRR